MAIYQPTNISPSLWGELGNGVVDATKALPVTWQVNGTSALTAFSITIYRNDAASTQLYTTGKRTDGCPFYGTNYAGESQLFSYTIPASALSGAGIKNGENYKLSITQYWGENESVTQMSASAFVTRADPMLSIEDIPAPLSAKEHTFTGSYFQDQGDTLNWLRWRLCAKGSENEPLYDTERIYGTGELQFKYDGLFSGETYGIRLQVQTENGAQADTGWVYFTVRYEMASSTAAVQVCCKRAVSGVYITWPRLASIEGTPSGSYEISGGTLELPAGSKVTWDSVTGKPMKYEAPWTVVWKGKIAQAATVVTVKTDQGDITINAAANSLTIKRGNTVIYQNYGILRIGTEFLVALTPNTVYFRQVSRSNGLYPDVGLHPMVGLRPRQSTGEKLTQRAGSVAVGNATITGLVVAGAQSTSYLWVSAQSLTAQQMEDLFGDGTFIPSFDESTLLLANFTDGLQAGNLNGIFGSGLQGFSIYRYETGAQTLRHVADVPLEKLAVVDCGARSQVAVRYYMFGIGADTYTTTPIISEEIMPVFWDWSVLECTKDENGAYRPESIFRFGKNLASGAISNNNQPGVLQNFTPYPTVQPSPSNYRSGTLTSLIGSIDREGNYSDTTELRDRIYALSVTQRTLFLKNRKGDIWQIRTSDAVSMSTADGTREQAQIVSLPWVETASAEAAKIILAQGDALMPMPPVELQDIRITAPPEKTAYLVNEFFSPKGMVVTAIFSNGTREVVQNYRYVPNAALTINDKFVQIFYSYGENTRTADVAISVSRIPVTVPSQLGSLTYNGEPQVPSWENYDPNTQEMQAVEGEVNAGTYSVLVRLKNTNNYCWEDGTTEAKTVTWSIGKMSVATPAQRGTLTYTGEEQSPDWSNYDSGKMTLSGATSGTNAGNYTATFSLGSNYQWADGATAAKNVVWKINKVAGSLSISPSSIKMYDTTRSRTITVTRSGDGEISAVSDNPAAAEVSVSGNTVTVTSRSSGSAKITVSVAEGTNYTAPASKTCDVSVVSPISIADLRQFAYTDNMKGCGKHNDQYLMVGNDEDWNIFGTISPASGQASKYKMNVTGTYPAAGMIVSNARIDIPLTDRDGGTLYKNRCKMMITTEDFIAENQVFQITSEAGVRMNCIAGGGNGYIYSGGKDAAGKPVILYVSKSADVSTNPAQQILATDGEIIDIASCKDSSGTNRLAVLTAQGKLLEGTLSASGPVDHNDWTIDAPAAVKIGLIPADDNKLYRCAYAESTETGYRLVSRYGDGQIRYTDDFAPQNSTILGVGAIGGYAVAVFADADGNAKIYVNEDGEYGRVYSLDALSPIAMCEIPNGIGVICKTSAAFTVAIKEITLAE